MSNQESSAEAFLQCVCRVGSVGSAQKSVELSYSCLLIHGLRSDAFSSATGCCLRPWRRLTWGKSCRVMCSPICVAARMLFVSKPVTWGRMRRGTPPHVFFTPGRERRTCLPISLAPLGLLIALN